MRITAPAVSALTAVLLLTGCPTPTGAGEPPTASNRSLTTREDTRIDFTVDAKDPEGAALIFTNTAPAHGSLALAGVTFTYTPEANYAGPDSATVTVSDGAASVTVTVSLTVTPVNDAPVAVDDTFATGQPITVASLLANDSDVDGDRLSVIAVGVSSVGTVSLAGDLVTFTPPSGFTGAATFEYTLFDGTISDTGQVTVNVTTVNGPPVALDDTATAVEDTAAVLTAASLLANDFDADGPALSVTAVSGATGGTVALAGTDLTFTPAANFTGAAGFDYTVSDGTLSDTGHVVVTVTPVNDAPVAVDDAAAASEDTAAVLTAATLLANDTDVDGPALTITSVSNATGGTVSLAGTSITFTPTANFSGAGGFDYVVWDGALPDTGHVAVTIAAVNDAPVAVDDTATTAEDTAAVLAAATLLANDTDLDGPALSLTAVSNATGGTVALSGTDVTFTPAANSTSTGGFDYTVSDGTLTDTGHVTLTVTAVNDAPVAVDDTSTATEDVAKVITAASLLTNDTDVDGPSKTLTAVSNPTGGTVALVGTNITFTPTANLSGAGAGGFDYTVSDGTLTDTGHVTITITAVNDAPLAVDDAASTPENAALVLAASTLLANDTDVDGTTPTVTAVSNPVGGTVALVGTTITFTPTPNFSSAAGFDYTITDGTLTDVGHVTVTINAVNDPPVAVDDTGTTPEDTAAVIAAATVLANDTDLDGPALSVTAVSNPTGGTVSLSGTDLTFTPAADFTGAAGFDYTVSDGSLTDTGHVTVTVTPVNDPPVAVDDSSTTAEDSAVVLTAATLLSNDTDPDGPSATVTAVSNATNGVVGLAGTNITFTPAADFNGAAGFDYTVSDGTLTDTGHVTVTVTPVNDAPAAVAQSTSTPRGSAVTITLTATDIDSAAVTFAIGTGPTSGTLGTVTSTGPLSATVVYTPNVGFSGSDAFTFTANDGALTSAAATVNVSVTPVCGDGFIEGTEQCDDSDTLDGNGCSATCIVEAGWSCTGAPSTCSTTCGDTIAAGTEKCDDGNSNENDGCTSQCIVGKLCTSVAIAGGDSFTTDPATGTCYVAFLTDPSTWNDAQVACSGIGGYLVTITSAAEQTRVQSIHIGVPWIGATDDANDTDAVFNWVTGEAWGFTSFAAGEPDDDASLGGVGECLAMTDSTGGWGDTNCNYVGYSDGRICEVPLCGDGIAQNAETCDDGNRTGGDGCSASCAVEAGAVCTGSAPMLCSKLVINEVDYDQNGTDNVSLFEFVEILNVGTGPADLTNVALVLANGATTPATEYYFDTTTGAGNVGKRILLTASTAGTSLPAGRLIVVAPAAQFAVVGFPAAAFQLPIVPVVGGWIQNGGPDGIVLMKVGGAPVVLDSFSYEGSTATVTVNGLTGNPYVVTEGAGHAGDPADLPNANNGLSRFPNGRDTNNNATDFALRPVTPGLAN